MIKAVIFDLDGTICDTISTIAHFGNLALEFNGFERIEEKEYKYFAGDGKDTLIHRMLQYHNADTEENFKKVENKYDFEYERDTIFETKPFDGICEELEKLKEKGIKTAVLSNKPDNVTVMVVEKLFGKLIDVCHGKMDNVEKKPDPQGVFMIADELGVGTDECIFVGDTNVDINTANNAKIPSIGVLWGFRDEAELKKAGADYIISASYEISDCIFNKNRE